MSSAAFAATTLATESAPARKSLELETRVFVIPGYVRHIRHYVKYIVHPDRGSTTRFGREVAESVHSVATERSPDMAQVVLVVLRDFVELLTQSPGTRDAVHEG